MAQWTYSQDAVGTRPDPPSIPVGEFDPKDRTHATKCRQFLDFVFRYNTTLRCELERQWNRYRAMDALHQWLQPSRTTMTGTRLWYNWEPLRLQSGQAPFPRPQHNVFSPAIQDEVARLLKVGSKPYVRADDQTKLEGAILARQLLEHRNRVTGFAKQNRIGCYHMALFGQWIHVSKWDVNMLNTTKAPALTARGCEHFNDPDQPCNFVLAQPEIGGEQEQMLYSKYGAGAREALQQGSCPRCGGELGEVDMAPDYYENEPDAVGQPLYSDQQLGEDVSEVVSPFSAFPFNGGCGYEMVEDMEDIGIRSLRSVANLKARYANAKDLKPEVGIDLLEHHPMVSGQWGLSPAQEGLWASHRPEDVYIMKPQAGFSRGMLLVMSGDRLLYHGELLMPGTDIPRYEVGWAQWELRPQKIWGKPLSEDTAALQVFLNGSLAQGQDIMTKWTSPKLMLHEGMNLQFKGGTSGVFPGDVWTINTRGIPPEIAAKFPHVFGNTGVPDSIYKMFEIAKEHVENVSGARGAEIGTPEGADLNYSALLFLAGKSAERRGPRNHDIRQLKVRIWSHRLRLLASFTDTPTLMSFQNDRDEWETKQIRAFQLQGQTDITLEEEPFVDDGVARRASIAQALQWQTIRPSSMGGTYATDRRINRAIGLPEDLNEDRNIQQDRAHAEWRDMLDRGLEPMVDVTSDDHEIHSKDHDLALNGPDGKKLKESLVTAQLANGQPAGSAYRWPQILRITWDWEKTLQKLQMVAQALETAPRAQEMTSAGAPPEVLAQTAMKLQKLQEMLGVWPTPLELQIENVWWRMILAAGLEETEPLKILVRLNAHRLAHYQLRAAALMPPPGALPPAGAPGAAPPGMAPGAAPPVGIDAAAQAA